MIIKVIKIIILLLLIFVTAESLNVILDSSKGMGILQKKINEEIKANKDLSEKYDEFIESRR